jgi:lysophospholipase L1-like esterase
MIRVRMVGLLVATAAIIGAAPPEKWVGSWATSQQTPEPQNALPAGDLDDATLRAVVKLSLGGHRVRVQVSNAFGTVPLRIDAAHIALSAGAASARIVPASDRALTFDGASMVTVPAGASYWSDPVTLDAPPLAVVAVSLHLPKAPIGQTAHPGSHATSYVLAGNHVADADLGGAKSIEHWYQVAGIAVGTAPAARAVVTFGDSITDGHGSTTNGNDRWPDQLAERLHAAPATRSVAVLNQGIGGNRLLNDGTGPNALARFDRDVLAQPGVRYVILLEGINDIGTLTRAAPASKEAHDALVARMIGAYRQFVDRSHAAGIKVYGATILPDGASDYYHPDALGEADRAAVNAWIRAPGHFDAVIDFDAVTRDPADPRKMKAAFDSGDGLHPSPAGYKAMAAAILLDLFK